MALIVAPLALAATGYGLLHCETPAMAAPPPPTVTVTATYPGASAETAA